MKLQNRSLPDYMLLVVTTVIVLVVVFSAFLPLSGALWQESLTVSGEIHNIHRNSCTYSFGFWMNHSEEWPVEEITIGEETYSKDEAIEILETPPAGDATYILAHQLIAAKLNILNDGDDQEIIQTLNAADLWLAEIGLGNKPGKSDKKTGVELAGILENYNTGKIGPGHCDDEEQDSIPAPETADQIITPEDIALPTLTDETPAPTYIPTSTGTSVPTHIPTSTGTSVPTHIPTSTGTSVPTDIPVATDTPIPSDPPVLTVTPIPTDTTVPTDIIVPTDTPTNP